MEVSSELLEQLLAHAHEEAPNECCGVLAVERTVSNGQSAVGQPAGGQPAVGQDGGAASVRAVAAHRAVNTAASPLRFEIDGREVMRLIDQIEDAGLELGAIYHSHTRTAPYPSQTDINFAASWPGVEWVIVGLADPANPEIRSYLIEEGRVREVALAQTPAG